MRKLKILVVSNTPWNSNNSFGNTYSNIFGDIEELEFANIYCRYGNVNEKKVVKSFQITEKTLIRNLKDKNIPSGSEINFNNDIKLAGIEKKAFDTVRKNRFRIFALLRELVWKIGRWQSYELQNFIDDFNPDLIIQPVYYSSYINDIAMFCKKYTNKKMLCYISDDCYTLKQINFSPIYWIERLWKRTKIKKTIDNCEILYVISEIQKKEYEKIFKKNCKILTKCEDFSEVAPTWEISQKTIKLMYAGNISKGREKSLSYISNAVERLNKEGYAVTFDIYTRSIINVNKLKKGTNYCGAVPYSEICRLQREADIMVHVEGLSIRETLAIRQSFSTKLVDFFKLGKCIFAIGSKKQAFAKHLIDNKAAVVAECEKDVYVKLKELLDNPEKIHSYGKKAYECGKYHHSKEKIQAMLRDDLSKLIKE